MTLAPKTASVARTTPRVAARPTASADCSAFSPVQQPIKPTSRPKTTVLSVAGITSENLRKTRESRQKTIGESLPPVSSPQQGADQCREIDEHCK